ncbi:hypothetical protein SVIO_107570 [Streptomyces violaceusniger]|uniref:Uncharacterized protein n=1 Tax=Streptomyces violaceusniger TaxID=68280 RepID=A0A4D4LI50_STRVO|nr:hypothetical protein SVIO_107570 [Streptomyces violaceusniger]
MEESATSFPHLPSPRLARFTEGTDLLSPVRLLESNSQHRRVATPLALVGNPHTPCTAAAQTLPALHPLELSWITRQSDAPDWQHTAAAALAPAYDTEGVLRLPTDDELDRHPDPCAVLQSWLDAPERDGLWSSYEKEPAYGPAPQGRLAAGPGRRPPRRSQPRRGRAARRRTSTSPPRTCVGVWRTEGADDSAADPGLVPGRQRYRPRDDFR